MDTPLIQTVDLVKYFNTKRGPLHAVDHVNLSIKKGETLGVVGESGCGSLHWEEQSYAFWNLHPVRFFIMEMIL